MTNDEIQQHIEQNCRHEDGSPAMDEQAFYEGAKWMRDKALGLSHVSISLPIKKYEIDFDGNVLAGIEISENTPKVFGAMTGYGNGIKIENIKITEK